jgi:multidrug transporter EmrE-like cation transporter
MLFLILSILCSVTVGVIFKLSRNYTISVIQIVTWNYLFALVLCFFAFSPDLNAIDRTAPWSIYITLGILMPSIFIF